MESPFAIPQSPHAALAEVGRSDLVVEDLLSGVHPFKHVGDHDVAVVRAKDVFAMHKAGLGMLGKHTGGEARGRAAKGVRRASTGSCRPALDEGEPKCAQVPGVMCHRCAWLGPLRPRNHRLHAKTALVQMAGGGPGCRHPLARADAGRLVATWPRREVGFTRPASGFPCKWCGKLDYVGRHGPAHN